MLGEENYSCHLRSHKVNVISVEISQLILGEGPWCKLTNDIEQ